MKTLKILTLVFFAMAITSCSKNDDTVVVEEVVIELTTEQLLTSGPWLVENVTGATMDDCNRQTSFNFTDSGFLIIESYETNAGVCEYNGSEAYSYTLSDMLIIVESGGGSGTVITIDSISQSQLLLSIGGGGAYIFRK